MTHGFSGKNSDQVTVAAIRRPAMYKSRILALMLPVLLAFSCKPDLYDVPIPEAFFQDIIIDLRNSFVSRLARKKTVYRLTRPTGKLHKVEEYARVMRLSPVPNPKIWIGDEHRAFAREIIPDGIKIIGIGAGASHLFKRWPAACASTACCNR